MQQERVIVTGATRGIGHATATTLLNRGAIVGLNYIASEKVADELKSKFPSNCIPLKFDVSDHVAVKEGIDEFADKAGGIDCLVNNAGVLIPGLLARLPDHSITKQVAVNLMGPIYCTKAAIPHMLGGRRGLVVNIGSVASAKPSVGQTVYATTKGGLEAFTRAVSVEYSSRNIRAICISAGPTDTDLLRPTLIRDDKAILSRLPGGRLSSPQELADFICFLISPAGSFFNACVLSLDGGYGST
jgi:3-oxoacyl-[acyl-carrier protein] reductase